MLIWVWLNLKQWDHFVRQSYAIAIILNGISLRGLRKCVHILWLWARYQRSLEVEPRKICWATKDKKSPEKSLSGESSAYWCHNFDDSLKWIASRGVCYRVIGGWSSVIIEELSVVLSVIATKYHGCLPGGIQLRGATAAITGVLILGKLARLGFPRSTFLSLYRPILWIECHWKEFDGLSACRAPHLRCLVMACTM